MQSSTVRRLILGAALGCAGVLAFSAPARADDETQQPGGVLGAVVQVVDRALPEPTKAAEPEPEPTREPEPVRDEPARDEPTREPEQGTHTEQAPAGEEPATDDSGDSEPESDAPPANPIGDAIEDVKGGVKDTVIEVVEVVTAPLPSPPVVVVIPTPAPVVTPAPTQPAAPTVASDDTDTTEGAVDEQPAAPATETPEVDLPVDLPVVGPTAGTDAMLPGLTPDDVSHRADDTDAIEACDNPEPRTLDDVRKAIRKVIDKQKQREGDRADPGAPGKPCPGTGAPTERAINGTATATGVGQHGDQVAATTTGLIWPTLTRLQQLRARGDLPDSRSTHLDPAPA